MALSTDAKNNVLDAIFNNTSYAVTTPYISLHTGDPGTTGASEVSGGSYAREDASAAFPAAASGAISSNADVEFVDMPTATVTHVGVWEAVSGGNFIAGGALSSSVAVTSGETFKFTSGDLDGDFV